MKEKLEALLGNKIKKVHFIGIGGSSMSGLASILLKNGISVSGSDMKSSAYTEKLQAKGADIFIGHQGSNIEPSCSLVVYTAAISKDNPELLAAQGLKIPTMERSAFLGLLTETFPHTIAVAGTHGKTTTSSLIATILYEGDLDPTVSVGGIISTFKSNFHVGAGNYFVTEACEYVDSFLRSRHNIGIILNIEHEHVDYFKSLDQVKESFRKFAEIIPSDGYLIVNGDSPVVLDVTKGLNCQIIKTGLGEHNDYHAKNITYDDFGRPSYDVYKNGKLWQRFKLNIPGEHNVMNSLAAIACADICGVPAQTIAESLTGFSGAGRRFELRGVANGITVVEDYAHHPTEVAVTINACKNYKANNLIVVFQPHTFSRTFHFFDEIVEALRGTDHLIVSDIYSDREKNTYPVDHGDLAKAAGERLNIPAKHISDFDDIVNEVSSIAKPGDFVLVAGAGTINQVAYKLVEHLNQKK
ncbi:UDP-N-acetylmuramate--L-alanine ligase [Alkalibacter mobilis]|uniref:UDP-N-acetylmuramate--L-alanine ligase n=1 Tax=Alkalibacter mobilis TaxID=2787712 RepID=UPI00189D14E4|nr:UDP-N-acetylmuramate--L-alanine ligase [Alkalibacter mobilis]MBF7096942.1 UDP-N-acetylmuramate--L-alanine ligase [Alkalibacter mobilis]